MTRAAAFAAFAVTLRNNQFSWSGHNEKCVAITCWTNNLSGGIYKMDLPRSGRGFKGFCEDIALARAKFGGIVKVVLAENVGDSHGKQAKGANWRQSPLELRVVIFDPEADDKPTVSFVAEVVK